MELREAGVGGHVLILGVIPEEYIELMFQWDFSVPVSSLSQAEYIPAWPSGMGRR